MASVVARGLVAVALATACGVGAAQAHSRHHHRHANHGHHHTRRDGASARPAAAEPARPPTSVAPAATAGAARTFRGHDEDALLHDMATRPVLRVMERFSSSTLVYHCDLGNGLEVAFKPARRGEHQWWKHEVLGYRLARVLGITGRVPPVVSRTVPLSALRGYTHGADLIVERDGTVRGAAIFWMPVLHHAGLHTGAPRAQWEHWLDARTDVPPANRRRASQISALLAFDYLQANFDRWNTANVPVDEHDDLVFRDNNRGWFMENLARTDMGTVVPPQRVPSWMLAGIERATPEAVRAEIARDGLPFHRLAQRSYWDAYAARREALLRQLREAITRFGRDRVLLDE